jgi:hypothetical protein
MASIRRRDCLVLLGSAAVWPLAANAQQAKLPVGGIIALHHLSALRIGGAP